MASTNDDMNMSDESSFYGDEDVRDEFEHLASRPLKRGYEPPVPPAAFNKKAKLSPKSEIPDANPVSTKGDGKESLLDFLRSRPQVADLERAHLKGLRPAKKQPPRTADGREAPDFVDVERDRGRPDAWQQSEDIIDFLRRLPVSEPDTAQVGPWLWVSSPRIPWSQTQQKPSEISAFEEEGVQLLQAFGGHRAKIERENPDKEPATITRKLGPYRDQLEDDLLTLAVQKSVTCGKWMLFGGPEDLPKWWRLVATATSEGKLGPTSKVGTWEPGKKETVICIYTYDFSDTDDLIRVLRELADLGLVAAHGKPIYYKCDAYTYLSIQSNNPYRLRASLYSSKELLQNEAKALKDGPVARLKKRNMKMDDFFDMFAGDDIS